MKSFKYTFQFGLATINVILFMFCLIAYFAGHVILLPEVKVLPEIIALNLESGVRASTITVLVLLTLFLLTFFSFPYFKVKGLPSLLVVLLVLFFTAVVIDLSCRIYDLVIWEPTGVEASLLQIFQESQDFDELQSSLKCCGVKDHNDYGNLSQVPSSCYKDPGNQSSLYKIGCTEAFTDWIIARKAISDGAVITFQTSEIIGMLPAVIGYKRLKKASAVERLRNGAARFARAVGLRRGGSSRLEFASTACVQQCSTQLMLRVRACGYLTEQLSRHSFKIVIFLMILYVIYDLMVRLSISEKE